MTTLLIVEIVLILPLYYYGWLQVFSIYNEYYNFHIGHARKTNVSQTAFRAATGTIALVVAATTLLHLLSLVA